ncbi:EAL domain-containing protein, partial [Frankia canadensis]|uniref:EAL domain-containing protein n=1 Tax=Frankia canadensis TaxID=1836972 RepID=UPI000C7DA4E9
MYRDRAHADRRRFLVVAPLGAAVLFLAGLLLPGSPGYRTWYVGLGLTVALANLAVGITVRPRARWPAPLAVASFAAMLGISVAESTSLPAAATYLIWFPPLAAYVALIRVPLATATMTVAIAMLVAGAAIGDAPGGLPAALVTSVALCVSAAALIVKGLFRADLMQRETDTLTRLPNRAGTLERGERAVQEIRTAGREAVLVLVDINRFHEINDALGHVGGDTLLRVIARTLKGLNPPPAFVGRVGGDEFAMIFRGMSAPAAGTIRPGARTPPPTAAETTRSRVFGRRVLRQIQGPFEVCGVEVAVDASVGIAVAPRDGTSMARLLTCADSALLRARQAGESVGLWDPGIAGIRPEEIALYAQLRSAISRDELVLYYQPLQSARSGTIVGVEALLRWHHPTRGLLAPGDFLPVVERSSLIADLTRWVLDEALRQSADWTEAGLHLPVSVNLSPRMLVLDDLPRVVGGALGAHGLSSKALTLEITESALVTQPARAATMLRQLCAEGVGLSLDDFGTGYSSMEILKTLPFNEVKIDRGFVTDASGSLPDAAIVRSVVDLGHRLGLRVVGEGIEDERTLSMMIDLGCDLLQGEAISVPLPAAQLTALLRARSAPRAASGPTTDAGPPPALGTQPSVPTERAATPERPPVPVRAFASVLPPPPGAPLRPWLMAGVAEPSGPRDTEGPPPAAPARVPPGGAWTSVSTTRRPHDQGTGAGSRPAAAARADAERLAVLRDYHLLHTMPESAFDDLAAIAARATGCASATIVFVDAAREWTRIHARTGASQLARQCGIGARVMAQGAFIEIQDLASPPRCHDAGDRIRFAAGAPIVAPAGHVLGALTVVDTAPRRLSTGHRAILTNLARQVISLLDARREAAVFALLSGALADLDRLLFARDLERAATITANVAEALLGASEVALMLAEMPGSTIYRVAGQSVGPGVTPVASVGEELERDSRLLAEALRTQGPLFVADAASSPLIIHAFVERYRLGSVFLVPLPGEGGLLGVIAARWEDRRGELDPVVVQALTLLARQAAHTLVRLRASRDSRVSACTTTG